MNEIEAFFRAVLRYGLISIVVVAALFGLKTLFAARPTPMVRIPSIAIQTSGPATYRTSSFTMSVPRATSKPKVDAVQELNRYAHSDIISPNNGFLP